MNHKDIKFRNYSSNNYGVNSLCFTIGNTDYYFSYETLVAFRNPKIGLVCQKNYWGNTTGKHLNWIQPDKTKRVNENKFNEILATL